MAWPRTQSRRTTRLVYAVSCVLTAVCSSFHQSGIAQEKAEVFVQLGHSLAVQSVALSPDGRYALSGSLDGTVKLWDVVNGREIRTLTGHSSAVYSVAFSPDGKLAASGSRDATIRIWRVETGQEIKRIEGHSATVYSVAFSPDGRYILAGAGIAVSRASGAEDNVMLWDVTSGAPIRSFKGQKGSISSVAFSPDGQYVASAGGGRVPGDNAVIVLWAVSDARSVSTLSGHKEAVTSVAFSPDSRFILSGSIDRTAKLWAVASGVEVRSFVGHTGVVASVAFSPDGKYAVSGGAGGPGSKEVTLRLWDVAAGTERPVFAGDAGAVTSLAYSRDGRYVLSGSRDSTLKLWNVATGREIRVFTGHSSDVTSVAFSPGPTTVVSAGADGRVNVWDLAGGQRTTAFVAHRADISSVAVSPLYKVVLTGALDGTIKLTSANGRPVWTVADAHKGEVTSVAFSPGGKVVLSGGRDHLVKLWDATTGALIRSFPGHSSDVNSVAFSPDGRYAVSGSGGRVPREQTPDTSVKIWDVAAGTEYKTLTGQKGWISCVAFSPDNRYVVSSSYDRTVLLWDVDRAVVIKNFVGHSNIVRSVAFTADGKYIVSGSDDKTIKVWDVATQKEVQTFIGHSGPVKSVGVSADGWYLMSGSVDGTSRLWSLKTGRELAQLIGFGETNWIVITPEGFYNSSPEGDRYLNLRVGNNVYGIDQYRATFYKPQTVASATRPSEGRPPRPQPLDTPPLKPPEVSVVEPPFLVIKSPEDGHRFSSTAAEISLYVEDRARSIKTLKAYVNGRLGASRGLASKSSSPVIGAAIPDGTRTLDLKLPVILERGENVIEVVAFNGFAEAKKTIHVFGSEDAPHSGEPALLPRLWMLSIGVSRYDDSSIPSLSFAADDAQAIVDVFTRQQGQLFSKVNSLLINDGSSTRPTYANIVDSLNYLARAGQNDVALLFIAGHGVNDEKGDFYFLPSDAAITEDGSIRRSRAIGWHEIITTLDLPSKVLVFVDTCHSEGVIGKKTRGVDNDRLVKELQEANAVVFTSSRGSELAQESERWRHGAFTHALVRGLSGEADLIKDGRITMKELDVFVSELVPRLTNGAQHPITHTPEGYIDFPVGLVKQK